MNKIARSLSAIAVALLTTMPLTTHANIATFDDVPNMSYAPFTSGGLDFNSDGNGLTLVWHGPGYNADNGTLSLISGFDNGFTITKNGGGLFSIDQLDAGLSWYTALTSFDVSVGGNLITLSPNYQTYTFSNLINLSSLTVSWAPSDGYMSFDNIVWRDGQSVPEPETLLLLSLGLVGVIATHRKNLRG